MISKLGGKESVIDSLGLMINTGYTASKILWLKQQKRESYQKISSILLPYDYINFWLTGRKTTEHGDASGTGYFDVKNGCWSQTVLSAIDPKRPLIDCLSPILESQQLAGTLTRAQRSLWG